jgi:hypothetical protein
MRCIFYVSSSPEHPRVLSDSRTRIRISAPFRRPQQEHQLKSNGRAGEYAERLRMGTEASPQVPVGRDGSVWRVESSVGAPTVMDQCREGPHSGWRGQPRAAVE